MPIAEVLAELLPITHGPFSVSLASTPPGETALEYRGMEAGGLWWKPNPSEPVERLVPVLDLGDVPDEQLRLVLGAWAVVLGEVFLEQAGRPNPSVKAHDVLRNDALLALLKAPVGEEEALARWREAYVAELPLREELLAAQRAIVEHFKEHGSTMADGELPGGFVSLDYVEAVFRAGELSLVVRLVVWDRDEQGAQSIRDVKEQEVHFLSPGPGCAPARVKAFLTAFKECMSQRLSQLEPETLMPHDLLLSPQHYKRGESVDDFRSLLRRKLKLS